MQSLDRLPLVVRALSAETKHRSAEGTKLPVVIAKPARLWRAAARSGNGVPFIRPRFLWASGTGKHVDNRSPAKAGKIYLLAVRRIEGNGRNGRSRQVIAGSVVYGNRKPLRNCMEIVRIH